jgi:hypothetical protein
MVEPEAIKHTPRPQLASTNAERLFLSSLYSGGLLSCTPYETTPNNTALFCCTVTGSKLALW